MESQFESQASAHDADRWGTLWTDGERRGKVRRLADVVRARRVAGISTRQAVALVVGDLDRLLSSGIDGVYRVAPEGWPVALQSADVFLPPSLNPDREGEPDGEWRWLSADSEWVRYEDEFNPHQAFSDADGCSDAARGIDGMRQCLAHWAARATCDADLDRGTAAYMAVSEALAAQLGLHGNVVQLHTVESSDERPALAKGVAVDGGLSNLPKTWPTDQAGIDAVIAVINARIALKLTSNVGAVAGHCSVSRSTVQRLINAEKAKRASSMSRAANNFIL